MLNDHRRTLLYAAFLLAAMLFVFVAVGRHAPEEAPMTTVPFVGELDLMTKHAMDDIRNDPTTLLAKFLNVLGSGVVTVPLRSVVAAWLALRRRWRAFATWAVVWASAEILLTASKVVFHRGRPLGPLGALVGTVGYSFPSGHAVAGTATAVALVLVLTPPGPRRRRWELIAVAFASLMAFSRVYLSAHWLSDVVAGVLLGAGVALGSAALATEVRDLAMRRRSGWPEAA